MQRRSFIAAARSFLASFIAFMRHRNAMSWLRDAKSITVSVTIRGTDIGPQHVPMTALQLDDVFMFDDQPRRTYVVLQLDDGKLAIRLFWRKTGHKPSNLDLHKDAYKFATAIIIDLCEKAPPPELETFYQPDKAIPTFADTQ